MACGLRKRNIGAWFNHSCAPNCFVQPLLDCHHDERCPRIGIFAMGEPPLAGCRLAAPRTAPYRRRQFPAQPASPAPPLGPVCADNIPPMTELTIDYGEEYAKEFVGGCKCGAADCISKRA